MAAPRVLVRPRHDLLVAAVTEGGGAVVDDDGRVDALVWADARDADGLASTLVEHPEIRWVQLPFAGVEPLIHVVDEVREWTCGKGVYADPCAEHALALTLAGLRNIAGYARATEWSGPVGRNLLGARVVVVGGGGIAEKFLDLLGPFGAHATVVRRSGRPMDGADRVVTSDRLDEVLVDADVVVLALALTPETRHIIDRRRLGLLPEHAWVVNVARGGHIDTEALVAALRAESIGGATLDVTDPEPLPADHPLWRLPNCIITPHIANTPAMGAPLLAGRVRENVARFVEGRPLLGPVDVASGY